MIADIQRALSIKTIPNITIDSRHIHPGELFLAIAGEHYDGHDFVEQALKQGACGAIVSQVFYDHARSMQKPIQQLIPVPDTQTALCELATEYRNTLILPVIALTGSCGKTTTKEMIANILREQYQPIFATPGNKNNHLGVPLSILRCSPSDKMAVFELGANHIGEIHRNVMLVKPTIALITNVGVAHIGEFGSVNAIFSAKSEIFDTLTMSDWAIYPYEDIFADSWKKLLTNKISSQHTLTFGVDLQANIRAEAICYNASMCAAFQLMTPTGTIAVQLAVPGEHSVMNALAAAAVGFASHIPLEKIATGLAKFTAVSRRMTVQQGYHGARVIDDSYNANIKSVEAAMKVLAGFPGKRLFVLGDMGELGEWAIEHHQLIGKKAHELGLDGLLTCGPLSVHASQTFAELNHAISKNFSDTEALSTHLKTHLDANTTVVIKGSFSAHMNDVVSAITSTD